MTKLAYGGLTITVVAAAVCLLAPPANFTDRVIFAAIYVFDCAMLIGWARLIIRDLEERYRYADAAYWTRSGPPSGIYKGRTSASEDFE